MQLVHCWYCLMVTPTTTHWTQLHQLQRHQLFYMEQLYSHQECLLGCTLPRECMSSKFNHLTSPLSVSSPQLVLEVKQVIPLTVHSFVTCFNQLHRKSLPLWGGGTRHDKDSAYTMGRIQSYTLFLLCRNGDGVIIQSWIVNFVHNQADAARCGPVPLKTHQTVNNLVSRLRVTRSSDFCMNFLCPVGTTAFMRVCNLAFESNIDLAQLLHKVSVFLPTVQGAARLLGYQLCLKKRCPSGVSSAIGTSLVPSPYLREAGRTCTLQCSLQIIDSLRTSSFKQPSQTAIILQETKPAIVQL